MATIPAGWTHPIAAWNGYLPKVSDGFDRDGDADDDHRQHLGADIMFRRKFVGDQPQWGNNTRDGSLHYFAPKGTLVHAVGDAIVKSVSSGGLGTAVVLEHPGPYRATFYQHLERATVKRGDLVRAGQVIGVMGGSLTGYPLRHLHFEIWPTGSRSAGTNVDPAPILAALPLPTESLADHAIVAAPSPLAVLGGGLVGTIALGLSFALTRRRLRHTRARMGRL